VLLLSLYSVNMFRIVAALQLIRSNLVNLLGDCSNNIFDHIIFNFRDSIISYLIHDLSVLSLHCVLCIFANLDCMFVV